MEGHISLPVLFLPEIQKAGTRNASIHRMLVLDDEHLTVRIVPRHLYTLSPAG